MALPTERWTPSPAIMLRTIPTRRTFNSAWRRFGIVGLETNLSLCYDKLVRPGIISLSRLVELFHGY